MLEEIAIDGLGVIDATKVSFGSGFTVVTGETGAGKSMLLESLDLLSGKRADPSLVRHGKDRCTVDGIFVPTPDHPAFDYVQEAGGVIDDDKAIYVSRQVVKAGRSRAYLNGRPVPAGVLAEMANSLVTIHGQSDQNRLLSRTSQRDFVDTFGGQSLHDAKQAFDKAYREFIQTREDKMRWDEQSAAREEEITYLREGLDMIDEIQPQENEDVEIARRIERLMNVEDLRGDVTQALDAISARDDDDIHSFSITQLLYEAIGALQRAESTDDQLESTRKELQNLDYVLQDIAQTLASYLADLDADPYQLENDHQRLAQLKQACAGRAENVNELLIWARGATDRVAEIDNPHNSDEAWTQRLSAAHQDMLAAGRKLTEERTAAASALQKRVNSEIHELAMPDAMVEIQLNPLEEPASYGCESIQFLLQPHAHADAMPLAQVASGGELSRVMLALEVSILGQKSQNSGPACPTLVFDEVDAGIGGHAANVVAQRLAALSKQRQVIVVTHLAQVAALAHTHVHVLKEDATTTVSELNTQQRIGEIARMLSGDTDSEAARDHAKDLLGL